jgi:hypothetical protein
MDSNFINNIIPRLRRFARSVEIREALVDKIWEIFDDPENLHDYQFLRDQRLIMTYNGDVKFGQWEILPGRRLLIKRDNDNPINLLYDFSINGVVLMKKAGNNQAPFLLYDKNVIPNGNIIGYLLDLEKGRLVEPDSPIRPPSYHDTSDTILGFIVSFLVLVFLLYLFTLL